MKVPKDILKIFDKYKPLVNKEIRDTLSSRKKMLLYDMLSYFLGYLDEDLIETESYGGKGFRSGLCFLFADFYNVPQKEATEVAAAIEIFHNFTLIHDDIADKDEFRRGRETVWKKWGISHGINAGDAALMLSDLQLLKYLEQNPEKGVLVKSFLNEKYLEIAEGQFLDFCFSETPLGSKDLNEESILEMIAGKSAILVGASVKVAGIMAGLSEKEQGCLWEYGYNLGLTYQLCDDYLSIWGGKHETGKHELADIREKKKTLPILYLYQQLDEQKKAELEALYNKQTDLSETEILKVKEMLSGVSADRYLLSQIRLYLDKTIESIERLNIPDSNKGILKDINKALFPLVFEGEKC